MVWWEEICKTKANNLNSNLPKTGGFFMLTQETTQTTRLSQWLHVDGWPTINNGRSSISFPEVSKAKSARKVVGILNQLKHLIILGPETEIGNQAMIHDFTGLTFVNTDFGQHTPPRFIHARTIISDSNGGHSWGNGEQLNHGFNQTPLDLMHPPFITSGPCLFSAEATIGITASGQKHRLTDPYGFHEISIEEPIVALDIDSRLQPYEAEAILRLTQSIASIHEGQAIVGLDLPRVAYKLYLMGFFLEGIISQPLYLEWLEAVDIRTAGIANLIKKRLPATMDVQIIEPLAPINEFIYQIGTSSSHQDDILATMQEKLIQSDELWAKLLLTNPAKRFVDLGYLGYPMTHLMATRAIGSDSALVVIENPEETKIMDATFQALNSGCLPQPHAPIIGLYPHPDVIITDPSAIVSDRNQLYFYTGPLLPMIKEVVDSSKRKQ